MTSGSARWLAPVGAAAAVLALFVVPGVITASGTGDAGPGPDGVVSPGLVTPTPAPDRTEGSRPRIRDVDVVGYRAQGRTVRVFYTVDQATDCSSRLEKPVVEERPGSVVIRLQRRLSGAPEEVCVHLLLTNSVDITLARPLGDRLLQDGSHGDSLVPIQTQYRPDTTVTPPNSRSGR